MAALSRAWIPVLAGILAASMAVGAPACRKKAEPAPQAQNSKPDHVYIVRGKVMELPDPKKPMTEFVLRHEAIDSFADDKGKVVGMGTMEMPFPPAKGVSLADIAVGDVVEIEFAVWYKPMRRWNALSVRKLPADTVLEFRQAQPQSTTPN